MKKIFALICTCLLLAACGQSGQLFMPGNGKGYYRTHTFDGAPKQKTQDKKDKAFA